MPLGISIREFARLDGCSHTRVQSAIKTGHLKTFCDGKLDPALVGTAWRRGNFNGNSSGNLPTAVSTAVDALVEESPAEVAERILAATGAIWSQPEAERIKENFLALLRKQEFEERSAKLISKDAIELVFGTLVDNTRAGYLSLPTKAAPYLLNQNNPAVIVRILTNFIYDILRDLSESTFEPDGLGGLRRVGSGPSAGLKH